MITRIVRLSFQEEHIDTFLEIFDKKMRHIKTQPGCSHLELHRDANKKNVFYTLSHWNSEEDLDNYRHSDLFGEVWPEVKQYFNEKPLAYSLEKQITVE